MEIKNTENSEHYIWGNSCDGWHLLKSDSLSIIQERMLPKTSEQLHFHSMSQQFFYILKGTATFEINNKIVEVPTNSGMHIRPKENHRILNNTDFDLDFIVISEPKSHGDRTNI